MSSEEESCLGINSSSSSDSSEELDDEFMLRLYTGKLTSDAKYVVCEKGYEINEKEADTEQVRYFFSRFFCWL